MDFYKDKPVDLFVNVSEIEGIPVSIMEAISFGIPCIGTNVGGVSEIVNEQTGFLIDKNFEPNEVAELLSKYLSKLPLEKNEFRLGVKLFWKENYDASTITKIY
ncbi:MAG: glycosyltransferase [Bacteroidetes bacterium]|nr:glycosyltransferase [Bacteroidota bacterium]